MTAASPIPAVPPHHCRPHHQAPTTSSSRWLLPRTLRRGRPRSRCWRAGFSRIPPASRGKDHQTLKSDSNGISSLCACSCSRVLPIVGYCRPHCRRRCFRGWCPQRVRWNGHNVCVFFSSSFFPFQYLVAVLYSPHLYQLYKDWHEFSDFSAIDGTVTVSQADAAGHRGSIEADADSLFTHHAPLLIVSCSSIQKWSAHHLIFRSFFRCKCTSSIMLYTILPNFVRLGTES